MKRFMILLLCLFLTGCSSSGKTAEDVMNGEEVSDVPDAPDLEPLREDEDYQISSEAEAVEAEEDSVGLMAFYPNGQGALSALAGMNTFTFYFERNDVVPGSGRIGLYDADAYSDPLCSVVDVSDSEHFKILPIDENGVNISNFENGVMAIVTFDVQFEPGKNYYVLLDNGCFKRSDIVSTGIANASYITFSVKDYGIKGRLEQSYPVNSDTSVSVLLGGEASAASMIDYNSSFLSFSPATFSESGSETISFLRKTEENMPVSCTLAFYDDKGQKIDSCSFYFDIEDSPEPSGEPVENEEEAAG